jgi:polyisoprenoid-binding protein YceI
MRKILFALPLLFAIPLIAHDGSHAAPAGKAPVAAKGPDTSKITGGTYVVESTHAIIGWRVNHFNFNDYFGQFGNPTGTMVLDKANPAKSSVTIDIPISGLVSASTKLNEHMMKEDFFNAAAHPSAKFVSTTILIRGTSATINGNLTLLGVTKPVVLNAKLSGAGMNPFNKKETVGFHATGSIKRSDWGMGYGIPMVSDKVDLDITVAFEK